MVRLVCVGVVLISLDPWLVYLMAPPIVVFALPLLTLLLKVLTCQAELGTTHKRSKRWKFTFSLQYLFILLVESFNCYHNPYSKLTDDNRGVRALNSKNYEKL